MKADESAECAGRRVGQPPHFWDLEIVKFIFLKTDFGWVQI
jgi:hypothetical protein